jgi:uncharacterized phage infection (PIP) family protein YhgE
MEKRVKELEDENHLLLNQLHVVQEKLEKLYLASENATGLSTYDWVDDELPEVLAENIRYRALLDTQRMIQEVQATQSLSRKLGDILIQGVNSPSALLAMPAKLLRVWRQTNKQGPVKLLGGKGFDNVIKAYREKGQSGVDTLLSKASVSDKIQANALTALARTLMRSQPGNAAEVSRRAYELHPRPFRLKWLAFRLYEAGDVLRAETMLDSLPSDIAFSDTEKRSVSRLLDEAKRTRIDQAKQQCDFSTRRALVEQSQNLIGQLTRERDENRQIAERSQAQVGQLKKERDEHKQLAEQHQSLIGQLTNERDEYKQITERSQAEVGHLTKERDEHRHLAEQRQSLIGKLTRERDEYKQLAERSQDQVGQFTRARDEFKQLAEQRQAEVQQLHGSIIEMEHRQRLFSEEMSRAEGQIDLIKDVLLLPEPGA